MANEIQFSFSGRIQKGSFLDVISQETLQVTQSGVGDYSPTALVGTTEEDLLIGDIGTLGWLYLKNLDTTNYVTWGPKSGGVMIPLGRIEPGEFAVLRLEPGVTLRWKANSSAVRIKVRLYED